MQLDELVDYYSHSRRGLVCALTIPIGQKKEEEEEQPEDPDDSGDCHVTRSVYSSLARKG